MASAASASRPLTADVRADWEWLIGEFEAFIQASGLALGSVEHLLGCAPPGAPGLL
jgi:hypothetical protein